MTSKIVANDSTIQPTLPSHYYWSEDIYTLEKENVFYNSWLCVGRADRIPSPGDFFVQTVADESVIVTRDKTGKIYAFYNVCRHRGNRLCSKESGKFKGGALACRYHGWTYSLNGELIATPNMLDTDGFLMKDFPLYPVSVHLWEGFIFMNLSPPSEPFAPDLGPLATKIPHYNLEHLNTAHRETFKVKANWKLLEENNLECYHCPGVHPELCNIQPNVGRGRIGSANEDGNPLIDGGNTFSFTAMTDRLPISTITKEDEARFRSTTIYPTFFLGLLPDHVFTFTPWPVSVNETMVVVDWLFEPNTIESPGFDPSDSISFLTNILQQDFEIVEEVQKGIKSRVHRSGVYSSQEHLPHEFNQWLLDRL